MLRTAPLAGTGCHIIIQKLQVDLQCDRDLAVEVTGNVSRAIRLELPKAMRGLGFDGSLALQIDRIVLELKPLPARATPAQWAREITDALARRLKTSSARGGDHQVLQDAHRSMPGDYRLIGEDEPANMRLAILASIALGGEAPILPTDPGLFLPRPSDYGYAEWWRRLAIEAEQESGRHRLMRIFGTRMRAMIELALLNLGMRLEPTLGDLATARWDKGLALIAAIACQDKRFLERFGNEPMLIERIRRLANRTDDAALLALTAPVPHRDVRWQDGSRTEFASSEELNAIEPPSSIGIASAGLLVIWPFFAELFQDAGLLLDGRFIDDHARAIAVHLLDCLAWDDETHDDSFSRLILPRLICGCEPSDVTAEPLRALTARELDAARACLLALPSIFSHVDMDIDDCRQLFLQRRGQLILSDKQITVQLEEHASDILLGSIPWLMNDAQFPWCDTSFRLVGLEQVYG